MKTLSLALLLLPLSALAATLRVNNTPDTAADYPTIQAAINAAADGDTILIEGSATPYSPFTVTNKRLSLIGPGYGLAANLGTPANKLGAIISSTTSYVRTSSASAGTANGSLVMGLEFSGDLVLDGCINVTVARNLFNSFASGRVTLNGASNLVSQCYFLGSSGPAIQFSSTASGAKVENCMLPQIGMSTYGGGAPITVYLRNNLLYSLSESGAVVVAENNIFLGSVSPTSSSQYRNNLFSSSVPSNINGSGNLGPVNFSTVMPAYQNSAASFDGRYKIGPATPPTGGTNPAFNAGTDGTHIGPFGGSNPYILSGIPPLPTIDEFSAPTFASPGSTLTIRVKVSERP